MDLPKELVLGYVTSWVNCFHLRGTLNRWIISELKCKFPKRLSGTNKPSSAVHIITVPDNQSYEQAQYPNEQQQLPMNIMIIVESAHRMIIKETQKMRHS
jgi:type I site-specific restriction endonuclease